MLGICQENKETVSLVKLVLGRARHFSAKNPNSTLIRETPGLRAGSPWYVSAQPRVSTSKIRATQRLTVECITECGINY